MHKFFYLLLVLAGPAVYAGPQLDRGGKSLDFENFPISRKAEKNDGENLIQNGTFDSEKPLFITEKDKSNRYHWIGKYWRSRAQIWTKDEDLKGKIFPHICISTKSESSERKNVLILENRSEIIPYLDSEGKPMLANSLIQKIPLEESEHPGSYLFSMKAKGNFGNVPGLRRVMLICNFRDGTEKNAKSTGKPFLHKFSVKQGQWQDLNAKVTVPPGTKICEISICLYGVGKFSFDDIRFEKTKETKTASVKIYPMHLFDNTAYLGNGQANVIKFGIANQLWDNTKQVKLHLILPDGIKAIACSQQGKLTKTGKADGGNTEYVFDIGSWPLSKNNYFANSPNIILDVTAPASDRVLEEICYLSRNGEKGDIEHFKMRIVPSFKSRTPKLFKSGMCDLNGDLYFYDKAAECYADFYLNAGMNILHGYDGVNFRNVLWNELHDKNGMDRCSTVRWAANGCRFGYKGKIPDEIAFLDIGGKPFKDRIQYSYVCPTVVYKEDPKFLAVMQPILDRELKNLEMALPNWEPYGLDGRGCFCARCREEFIQYARGKLNEADIRANWPKKVAAVYPEIWKKFRSVQHAKVVRTMEKLVSEAGKKLGKETHFIPEITWDSITRVGNAGSSAKQYDPLDYLDDLPWLAPWGPYLYSDTKKPYQYYPGLNIIQLFALEEMKNFVTKHSKNGKGPKLIAMPGGGYGGAMSEPEALAMDTVSAFVAGFNGSIPWTFPFGCDYRWWRALAKANDMIAQNEDVVFNGSKVSSSVTIKPQTKLPRILIPGNWEECLLGFANTIPTLKGQSILQQRAFRKGDVTVVAVANFWAKGECFFSLAISDLPAGKYAVSDQYGISYGVFTDKELRKGILLQTGALRWKFFRFEKNGNLGKNLITQERMHKEMESVRKQLEAAADKDNAHSAAIEAEETRLTRKNSLSDIRSFRSGDVSLKAEGQFLRIGAPAYSLLLAPDEGGRILECVSGNDVLVKKGAGHIGQDGFWGPRAATMSLSDSYKLISCRPAKTGIEVELEYDIQRKNRLLDGLKIRKTWRFEKEGFQVSAVVGNASGTDRAFHFRYHNAPEYLRNPNGIYQIGEQVFERTFNVNMYRFGKPDAEVESLLKGAGQVKDLPVGGITLRPDRKAAAWKMGFPLEKAQAAVFWDSLSGSSAEVIFRKTVLKPGESETFSMNWRKQGK